LLVRTAWLEGCKRHGRLFADRPPRWVLVFSERVPIVKGRYDPKASSATSYSWFVWAPEGDSDAPPEIHWIAPNTRALLERPGDYDHPDTEEG